VGNIVHCIGDSHVGVFSGEDNIQSRWPLKSNVEPLLPQGE